MIVISGSEKYLLNFGGQPKFDDSGDFEYFVSCRKTVTSRRNGFSSQKPANNTEVYVCKYQNKYKIEIRTLSAKR